MFRTLALLIIAAITFGLAPNTMAKAVKIDIQAVNSAQRNAGKKSKPVLVMAAATVPKASTTPRDTLKKLFEENEEVAKEAVRFEWGYVEAYSPSDCNNGNACISPAVKEKYGIPLSLTMWTPTGGTYMWKMELGQQTFTNNDPSPSAEKLVQILKQAYTHWEGWQRTLSTILVKAQAKKVSDKKLKTHEYQKQLGDYYRAGSMVEEAVEAYENAAKLAKKAAKEDESLQAKEADYAFAVCTVMAEGKQYDDACAAFEKFAKKYKTSPWAAQAHIGAVQCMILQGDLPDACKALKKILKDKDLASIHGTATSVLENLEQRMKNKR